MSIRYDPKLPNDCGYECILRAALVPTTKSNVNKLRRQVPDRAWRARVEGEMVMGT